MNRTPPKRSARAPEKLLLPETAVTGPDGGGLSSLPAVTAPFFLQLADERRNLSESFSSLRQNARREHIRRIQQIRHSRVVVYYSITTLIPKHAELLHELLAMRSPTNRVDLFLLSPGGFADAAFKMATLCRAFATEQFSVLIPYYAKSAATLLSLGADELVMGPASEIGPIDPRIQVTDQYGRPVDVSAVSIRDALDMLELRAKGNPANALLYTPLLEKVDLNVVGEYERALKSSEQYAATLLKRYMLKANPEKAADVANKLAREYYSHGYAIDRHEAKDVLGLNVTEASPELWSILWQLHNYYNALIEESTATGLVGAIFESEDHLFTEDYPQQRRAGGQEVSASLCDASE